MKMWNVKMSTYEMIEISESQLMKYPNTKMLKYKRSTY